LGIIF